MDKELNEDARTKQDLLYECSSLECKLSDEIIKNEHLEQQCEKQKEVIDKAIEYIKEKARNNCWIDQYESCDLIKILKEVE